jgi:non-homologous end joining protein Ku
MPAPPEPVTASRENVINLMDALRRSIAAELPPQKPRGGFKGSKRETSQPAPPQAARPRRR